MLQPPLAPADLFLFPKLKTSMKVKRFFTIGEIKEKSKQKLLELTKDMFQKCFENWNKRLHKCIISEGEYFEGNKIVFNK